MNNDIQCVGGGAKVTMFASADNWIEGESERQLKRTAGLPGMIEAAAMPDIHPGKGSPVGAAFLSRDIFYPALLGNDVGCGMGLWKTTLKKNKIKRDKWEKKLFGLEVPWEGDGAAWLARFGIGHDSFDRGLGTIGGGNHFVELQAVEKVYDEEAALGCGLDARMLHILVHSGSRAHGEMLFRSHAEVYGANGLEAGSEEADAYLERYRYAVTWAQANRELLAERFASQIGGGVLSCSGYFPQQPL